MARAGRKRTATTHRSKGNTIQQAVLETAARLFSERGFDGTNLQDIADELGISRPALYYYFNSKEDILNSMIEQIMVFSERRTAELVVKGGSNPTESLRQLVQNHARWLLDHPIEFKLIDRSENELPVAVRNTIDRSKRVALNNFTRVIERGIEFGHFRSVNPVVTAFAIIGMCTWTAWWFRADGPLTSVEVAQIISDLAVHAVRHGKVEQGESIKIADAIQNLRDDLAVLEGMITRRVSDSV